MMNLTFTETIGYLASIVLVVSFGMKSMLTLRIVNTAGAALWVFYGVLLPSIPIAITNVIIIAINTYYLILLKKN